MAFDQRRDAHAPDAGHQAQNNADEYQLPDLYADVETKQRERDVALRQPELGFVGAAGSPRVRRLPDATGRLHPRSISSTGVR